MDEFVRLRINWGVDRDRIWVVSQCKAEFKIEYGKSSNYDPDVGRQVPISSGIYENPELGEMEVLAIDENRFQINGSQFRNWDGLFKCENGHCLRIYGRTFFELDGVSSLVDKNGKIWKKISRL